MLAGKAVLVTGAESGIGRAIALECAAAGAAVLATGLIEAELENTAAAARGRGGRCEFRRADITVQDDVAAAFGAAVTAFGHIDAVVANAGIAAPRAPAHEIEPETWRRMLEVNLTGTFLTVSEAARVLIRQGRGGSIVATGSSTAVRAMTGLAHYAASKAAVHMLMRTMALELAPHRIRVNTLVPGTTASPLTRAMPGHLERVAAELPLGEVVEPEELARYVVFALSDAMPHLTGSLLTLDSGRTIA